MTSAALRLSRVSAAIAFALSASGASAADYYLKLGDIKGEAARLPACSGDACADAGSAAGPGKDWIEIDSYSWGATQVGSSAMGSGKMQAGGGDAAAAEAASPRDASSGLPTGKRQHKPITITKQVDKSTPVLMKPLASGSMSFRGRVTGCAVGATYPVATLQAGAQRYEFSDVIITSCAMSGGGGGGSGGGALPMEQISFNYAKITTSYATQDKQSPKTEVRGWDPEKKQE